MADIFIGNLTSYPVISAGGVDTDDTFILIVDGSLRQITHAEALNLFQVTGSYQPLNTNLTRLAAMTMTVSCRSGW